MSELINLHCRAYRRSRLLSTVCAFAMAAAIATQATAREDERPTVWIEFGGQLERVDGGQSAFPLPYLTPAPSFLTLDEAQIQRPSSYAHGFEGKVTFVPEGGEWSFSAGVRFGRSNGSRLAHQSQGIPQPSICFGSFCNPGTYVGRDFANFDVQGRSTDTLIDFQAGKDVGLGVFGHDGLSHLALGVRFAQFTARSKLDVHARPDFRWDGVIPSYPSVYIPQSVFHNYTFAGEIKNDFRGVGPSLSWTGDASMVSLADRAAVTFDWGVNGALLFGRQKIRGEQQKTTGYINRKHYTYASFFHTRPVSRNRSVIVPNLGGFAGVSLKFPNAKLSLGYRADFFFGAMDGGIDTRKTYNRNFYGPFATISVGLGG